MKILNILKEVGKGHEILVVGNKMYVNDDVIPVKSILPEVVVSALHVFLILQPTAAK